MRLVAYWCVASSVLASRVLRRRAAAVISRRGTRHVLRVSAVPSAGPMAGTYGLSRFQTSSDMKTMRIMNEKGCVYVERRVFRRLWYRLSKEFRSNIEAYNWVKEQKGSLVTKR